MKHSGLALEQRALSLGLANAFDYAVRFLTPIVLVRVLDPESFGEYRQLWLLVYTVLTVVTFYMPYTLYYFVPRSEPRIRRLFVNQTILFMSCAGVLGAMVLWLGQSLMPKTMAGLIGHGVLVYAFIALWVATLMLDILPAVGEHVAWQSKTIIGLSLLRAAVVSLAALITGEFTAVLIALFL